MYQTKVIEKGQKQGGRAELSKVNTRTSNKKKEVFSRRQLEDLMGCNRQTYRRVGGSIRSKR